MRPIQGLHEFGILIVFLTTPWLASALDPHRTMSQYLRDRWSTEDGFPGGQVSAIAQTPDGYLWIAGEKGLVRFDGLNFRLVKESSNGALITHVIGLSTDAEGGLWIWMQGANVLRYHAGSFDNVTSGSGLPDLSITAMSPTIEGGILLSTIGQDTFQYRKGLVSRVGSTNIPDTLILSNAKTSDGRIWLGTRDTGLFYVEAGRMTPVLGELTSRKVNCLLPGRRNELWIGTETGLFFWDGSRISMEEVPLSLRGQEILAIATDRDGNLWIATARGLSRLSESRKTPSEMTTEDAMPGITAMFEDREGNLWIGSSQGLQRWRDGTFLQQSTRTKSPPLGSSGPVFANSEGRIWFGPAHGGLYSIENGKPTQSKAAGIGSDIVYSLSGRGSSLWIGRQGGGLTHLFPFAKTFRSKTYTQANGLAQNSVYAVHESADGTIWAGTLSVGLSMLKNGIWTTYTTADGLSSNTITAVEEDASHNIWVATPSGLNERIEGQWRTYRAQNGLPSDEITCLLPDDPGAETNAIWVGTANGLVLLSSANLRSFAPVSEILQEPVLGIAADRSGLLWLTTPDHILSLSRQKLLDGTLAAADIHEYSRSDGLPAVEGVRRSRSVVQDGEGRVWISTRGGLVATAPTALRRPAAPSVVQLHAILADGVPISLERAQIPASQRRIVFEFAAVSLTAPERLQYRYRLDGFDKGWSEPTSAREAVYTHLDPGSYRFHVVASNPDRVWSETESSQPLIIQPAFWQTNWFRLCCFTALLLLAWLAYLLRTRQVAKQLHLRFEERFAERMRIAQDLHDTFLQGFLSASMQLDVATDHVPKDSPAAPMLSRVLALMRQVLEDGRRALTQLRSGDQQNRSLEVALSAVPQELGLEPQTVYRVIVNGAPRPLDPLCSEELFLICREAVVNAYRHADATLIEVELAYERADLHIFVRDDGRGIDPLVARSVRDGHWGLIGMRERAVNLGVLLKIWSRPSEGTEIEIIIPGEVVFLHRTKSTYRNRIRARFTRNTQETLAEKEI